MRKIAVTGARGFIGRHLCATLRDNNDLLLEIDLPEMDVRQAEELFTALAEFEPDAIYHLAGQASVPKSWSAPLDTLKTNCGGTAAVLDAARLIATPVRILITSSASVYDGSSLRRPIPESTLVKPSSPYGNSKFIAEQLASIYGGEYGMDVVVVRPFNVIGHGQSADYVVPALARRVIVACNDNLEEIQIGNMSAVRDFIDARDAVRAMIRVMEAGKAGSVYNICSGVGVSIASIASELTGLAGCDVTLKPEVSLRREHDSSYVVGDPSLIENELGWARQVSLTGSLTDVLEEWKSRDIDAG